MAERNEAEYLRLLRSKYNGLLYGMLSLDKEISHDHRTKLAGEMAMWEYRLEYLENESVSLQAKRAGSVTSPAKAKAAAKNGAKGGRPVGSKDSYKRVRIDQDRLGGDVVNTDLSTLQQNEKASKLNINQLEGTENLFHRD